jgi:hypothetical protein
LHFADVTTDPDFDKKTTLAVWKTFIKQTKQALERNNRRVTIDKKQILKFAKEHYDDNEEGRWNGRQIRNAFHTAVAMAEFDERTKTGVYNEDKDIPIMIGREQFEKIAHTVNEFDDYMRQTLRTSYETKAAKEKMRAKLPAAGRSEREHSSKKASSKKKTSKSKISSDDSSEDEKARIESDDSSSDSDSESE